MRDYLSTIGFDADNFYQTQEDMEGKMACKKYLSAVAANEDAANHGKRDPWTRWTSMPQEFGYFALAFRDQLEVLELPGEPTNPDREKVTVTPMKTGPSTPQK